jgi:hypothetical protein
MNWKTTVHVLKYPVTLADKQFAAVTLREPDVDALEAIDELGIVEGVTPNIRQLRGIIVALADAPNEVIGKLHKDDLTALGELCVPLLEGAEAPATSTN